MQGIVRRDSLGHYKMHFELHEPVALSACQVLTILTLSHRMYMAVCYLETPWQLNLHFADVFKIYIFIYLASERHIVFALSHSVASPILSDTNLCATVLNVMDIFLAGIGIVILLPHTVNMF